MAKPWAKAFYNSKPWLRCRGSYIADRILIDGGLCENCREEPGYIVDHINELTPQNIKNPNVALNHCNLQYLCKKCHDIKTGFFCGKERGYIFSGDGQVLPIPPSKK